MFVSSEAEIGAWIPLILSSSTVTYRMFLSTDSSSNNDDVPPVDPTVAKKDDVKLDSAAFAITEMVVSVILEFIVSTTVTYNTTNRFLSTVGLDDPTG